MPTSSSRRGGNAVTLVKPSSFEEDAKAFLLKHMPGLLPALEKAGYSAGHAFDMSAEEHPAKHFVLMFHRYIGCDDPLLGELLAKLWEATGQAVDDISVDAPLKRDGTTLKAFACLADLARLQVDVGSSAQDWCLLARVWAAVALSKDAVLEVQVLWHDQDRGSVRITPFMSADAVVKALSDLLGVKLT